MEILILSVLQGVAEFLPVSSSGHLVIAQHLLGVNEPGMRLDVCLHFGTLLSIFVFYRKRIGSLLRGCFAPSASVVERAAAWSFAAKLLVSALPAIAVYFAFKDPIEAMFENARFVGALLMFTGAVLIGTRYIPRGSRDVNFVRALMMGLGQAIALLPGVSRSGMTIASARAGRVDPEKCAEFSFLMSAPLILGGTLLEAKKAFCGAPCADATGWGALALGTAVAAVVGYFSLALLVKALKGKWFLLFGPYCIAAGLAVVVFVR